MGDAAAALGGHTAARRRLGQPGDEIGRLARCDAIALAKAPGATSRPVSATPQPEPVAAGRQPNLGGNHVLAGADAPHLGRGAIGPAGQQLGARAAFGDLLAGPSTPSSSHTGPLLPTSDVADTSTRISRRLWSREGRHRSERAFVGALSILRQQLQQAARCLHLPPLPITSRLGHAISAPLFQLEILIDMRRYPGGRVIETAVRPRHSQHR
jgi:hypothetical protein